MEELKVYIWLLMWEFKNDKNAIELTKEFSSVYGHGIIMDHQVWN